VRATNYDALDAWLDLLRASESIKKAIDTRFRSQFGHSISRFDVMAALARAQVRGGGLRAGELSEELMVTEGNTTQVTAPLVREGLVSRRKSKDDARVVIFTLTKKGVRLFDAMAAAHRQWIWRIFDTFTDKELIQLGRFMSRLEPPVLDEMLAEPTGKDAA
jgi:DNA-binding MarR family transcriptional regulator